MTDATGATDAGDGRGGEDGADRAIPPWPHPEPPLRVPPVAADELADETAQLLQGLKFDPEGPVPNIFATLAHHPRLLKRWSAFGGTLLFRSELSARERELLILRTAWHCKAHYEWSQHVPLAQRVGVTADEVARVTEGPGAPGWDDGDVALLRAADELHADAVIGDATWAALAERYTPAQLVEIPMVVGQYHLVAFTLNSLGVQLDDDVAGGGVATADK